MKKLFLLSAILFVTLTAHAQLTPEPLQIPMRDGKYLSAHLYRPNQQGSFPVILIQTPYNKSTFLFGLPLGVGQNIAGSGYAFVVLDWRCFYGSTLACVPNPKRGEDGYDAVEWIAQQTWSNGKVGAWGPSALGNIQFMTAREQPPHLVCAVPMVASPQTRYGHFFPGGPARTEYLKTLGVLFGGAFSLVPANPHYNLIWQSVENSTMYPDEIVTPMLLIAGWLDHNTDDDLLLFDTLRALSPASGQHRLLIGPWRHGGTGLAQQGDLSFPEAAGWHNDVANQFFAYHLLGEGNGWDNSPFVQYFQMGDDEWLANDVFPPANLATESYYLTRDGSLVPGLPFTESQKLDFNYDPNDPSPTIGGKTLDPALLQGPYDQSQNVESRNDLLLFTSEILQKDIVVKGKIKAHLFVSSDRKDTDFALRLTEVYPNGESILLGETIRRMRFRNGYTVGDTAFMEQGQVYPVTLEFDHLANTFKAGNRLRLVVTSSNYPRYNRNMNTGGGMYPNGNLDTLVNPLVAVNSVQVEGMYPSRLELPVDDDAVGVATVADEEGTRVFPNPSGGSFFLENVPAPARLWLSDARGRIVKVREVKTPAVEISAEDLQPGMYFLRIENGGKVVTRKVVVTK